VKKPITANIQATKISMKPTPIIVSIEPHQSNEAAVANECSPDFCASVSKVFLKCVDARTKNTKATISPTRKAIKPAANPDVNTNGALNVKPVADAAPMTIDVIATAAAIKAIM
jgi:chromatin remodeling complex protein RSC6